MKKGSKQKAAQRKQETDSRRRTFQVSGSTLLVETFLNRCTKGWLQPPNSLCETPLIGCKVG